MRFSDYFATLPALQQTVLSDELTLGYGRLALAARLHREHPAAATMLGTLAAAYVSLRAALALLDPDADRGPALRAGPADALPPDWPALLSGTRREVVGALLEMGSEMARDAVAATMADAEVTVISTLVADALATRGAVG